MHTKTLIADSAYRLLTQKPITELTIADIATEAGVSSRTVYNHFQDKFGITQYICKKIDDEYYLNKNVNIGDLCIKNSERNYSYLWDHELFFKNILCYLGQNNLVDYMSELFLTRILRDIRTLQGCEQISEELLASAEFFSYSTILASYAMLKGVIPKRWQNANIPFTELYLPKPLYEFFSQHNVH